MKRQYMPFSLSKAWSTYRTSLFSPSSSFPLSSFRLLSFFSSLSYLSFSSFSCLPCSLSSFLCLFPPVFLCRLIFRFAFFGQAFVDAMGRIAIQAYSEAPYCDEYPEPHEKIIAFLCDRLPGIRTMRDRFLYGCSGRGPPVQPGYISR
ncbi:unnamed protein product [Effrenium voratum]|nr:unnamed protein product [Effrenium voratum]